MPRNYPQTPRRATIQDSLQKLDSDDVDELMALVTKLQLKKKSKSKKAKSPVSSDSSSSSKDVDIIDAPSSTTAPHVALPKGLATMKAADLKEFVSTNFPDATIKGTGRGGMVTRNDMIAYIRKNTTPEPVRQSKPSKPKSKSKKSKDKKSKDKKSKSKKSKNSKKIEHSPVASPPPREDSDDSISSLPEDPEQLPEADSDDISMQDPEKSETEDPEKTEAFETDDSEPEEESEVVETEDSESEPEESDVEPEEDTEASFDVEEDEITIKNTNFRTVNGEITHIIKKKSGELGPLTKAAIELIKTAKHPISADASLVTRSKDLRADNKKKVCADFASMMEYTEEDKDSYLALVSDDPDAADRKYPGIKEVFDL